MDDDDAGPQSLFVVVSWESNAPFSTSIIQLEIPQVDPSYPNRVLAEFSVHISQLPMKLPLFIWWATSLPPASSTEDLYIFPDWPFKIPENEHFAALPGFTFNLSTHKCKMIEPPLAPKYMGHSVTMGHHIYFMAQPCFARSYEPEPCFERYDTRSQSWKKLEPFPPSITFPDMGAGFIVGTAVLDDTILFNISFHQMWAYNVGRNKWCTVVVSNDLCYDMEGPAVVKDKTIYAVTDYCRSVMALTFESHETEGRLELYREYVVPHMGQRKFSRVNSYHSTKHLVHLGENKFCLVRCCSLYGAHDHQYIQVTNIDLTKEIVTNICLHEFPTPRCFDQFIVKHCFSMPKRKTTTASKEDKRLPKSNTYPREDEAKIVELPPELLRVHGQYSLRKKKQDFEQGGSVSQSGESKDHADTTPEVQEEVLKKPLASVVAAKSNVASKVSTISVVTDATKASTLGDGAASGRSNTVEEDTTPEVEEEVLKKPSASVVAAKSNVAFKVSTISVVTDATKASTLGDGAASGRSYTVEEGDSIKTSGSSSSGRNNKVKNHGVDSQSKTTSGGHNVGKDSRSNQPRRSKGGRGRSRK